MSTYFFFFMSLKSIGFKTVGSLELFPLISGSWCFLWLLGRRKETSLEHPILMPKVLTMMLKMEMNYEKIMLETFPYSNIKHCKENLLRKVSISNITLTTLGEKKTLLPIWQLWWYWSVTKTANCWLMLKLNAYDRNSSSDGWLCICWTDKMLQCLGCLVVSEKQAT